MTRTLLLGLFAWLPATAAAADPVDYARDVKPILLKHCVGCHGPDKQRSGLRLDTAQSALTGGNNGPAVIPGKAATSRLIQALRSENDVPVMPPPKEPRLTAKEVATLVAWVDSGAKHPKDEVGLKPTAPGSKHWSFQPVQRPEPPAVKDVKWVRNPIDRFILARLEAEGIKPSPEADRVTLIRRLFLDLVGLPPTPEEVDAFVKDTRPDAYERVVERLLASPHYGERWGRHWLDAARYADSNGYSIDSARSIWKYRDWVIDAFNRDLPFDQFTIEQLAGDLLPNPTMGQKIATGFHRNTQINQEGGIDVEQFRVEALVDRVNTTGTVWLGLTVGCCQCHDHKFDPLAQREYYQFFAFFNNADDVNLDVATPEQLKLRKERQDTIAKLEKRLKELDSTSEETVLKWEGRLDAEARKKLPANIQTILALPENGRTAKQKQTLVAYFRKFDQLRHAVGGLGDLTGVSAVAHAHLVQERIDLEKRLTRLKADLPTITTTMIVQERKAPRPTNVMIGGDFVRKGAPVTPGTPAVLPPLAAGEKPTRMDLAKWIVDPKNPLTARVAVNRMWQQYFGLGLVETDNDFGTQGQPPSHPELLDWLASEFIREGWSMKKMHRLIVTSAAYRQSSKARPDLAEKDARNRLLARQNRIRLEAEVVRDVALASSGLLNPTIGGPSVFPPQPEGVYSFTQVPKDWKANSGPERFRRGMYTHFWRSAPHPDLIVFDAPDGNTSCTRRNRSNTPLQALTLLNDQGFFEFAHALTGRVLEKEADDEKAVVAAFRLCLARTPNDRERATLLRLLEKEKAAFTKAPAEAKALSPATLPPKTDAVRYAAWLSVARVLLNLDEFITRE